MLRSTRLHMIVVLAVGALLGYAAASGKVNPFGRSDAAPPVPSAAPTSPAAGNEAPCPACSADVQKAELLARADTKQGEKAGESGKKPNILVIFGDDIGVTNLSCYSDGLMGYETPNIDRIAREGLRFLHYYGEQSCTASRSAFLTGQHIIRTGLSKVGFPGAPMGMSQLDPSVGGLLKNLGYAAGQFGKNHVGDRNETLPTVNGFDEFFGNLYHLNAEEEPELPDYPKDPAFKAAWGPRGVLKCKATEKDDPTVDPRFGKVGKQTI
ncbi:MAG TPA: sulfatase-like hydrolase/transferase, partial [Gemmataceae bacterium]|nr:sulfatase-like hydrolase/transferase [Gemmataceae bacterium]